MFISNDKQLLEVLPELAKTGVVAIDTEFIREKVYYPKLCLIQLGTEDIQVLVDPFTVDITLLNPLFLDESVVKVFHASSQDREIIYHECGILPRPIFDTQIAASLLGFTYQIGYASLVNSICGVKLAKADSFTDWTRRPLSKTQLSYSADDVKYLPQVYHALVEMLKERGREHWLDEDFEELCNPAAFVKNPRSRWIHLKRVASLNRKQLAIARELAAWRELEAQAQNLPCKFILSDELLVEAAKREPLNQETLFEVRGMREHIRGDQVKTILQLCKKAMDSDPETWPEKMAAPFNEADFAGPVDMMSALLHFRAQENDIATAMLASHSELVRIAAGYRDDSKVLTGWRYDILGRELLDLLDGKISMTLNEGKLVIQQKE